jgi:glycosyltransferase involved in cell wall biosynthesis
VPPENPLISVIIPTYNAARFLPEAVASVRAQGYAPLEIIVVDDGSSDETSRLVQSWGDVRYLYQTNQGPAAARNAGILAARGELFDFLDADDVWTPNHLRSLLGPLLADPDLGFVWGSSQVLRMREAPDGTRQCQVQHESVSSFLMGSALYRPAAFAQAGLFASHLRLGEDTDWFATARHQGVRSRHVDEIVLVYRRHAGSLTSTGDSNIMAVIKRSMERRRGTLAAS